jgi:predicted nuclease of predicted toxin-antitoxin system
VRVVLDACVPRRLADTLAGHEVKTVHQMGWGNLDDRPLLDAIAGRFDVLVTVDRSLPKQQSLDDRPFAVVVLRAKTNRLEDLLPLVAELKAALDNATPGQVCELGAEPSPQAGGDSH